jgi:hypothetical protein
MPSLSIKSRPSKGRVHVILPIGKVEKAKQYSGERERVQIMDFTALFRGEQSSH